MSATVLATHPAVHLFPLLAGHASLSALKCTTRSGRPGYRVPKRIKAALLIGVNGNGDDEDDDDTEDTEEYERDDYAMGDLSRKAAFDAEHPVPAIVDLTRLTPFKRDVFSGVRPSALLKVLMQSDNTVIKTMLRESASLLTLTDREQVRRTVIAESIENKIVLFRIAVRLGGWRYAYAYEILDILITSDRADDIIEDLDSEQTLALRMVSDAARRHEDTVDAERFQHFTKYKMVADSDALPTFWATDDLFKGDRDAWSRLTLSAADFRLRIEYQASYALCTTLLDNVLASSRIRQSDVDRAIAAFPNSMRFLLIALCAERIETYNPAAPSTLIMTDLLPTRSGSVFTDLPPEGNTYTTVNMGYFGTRTIAALNAALEVLKTGEIRSKMDPRQAERLQSMSDFVYYYERTSVPQASQTRDLAVGFVAEREAQKMVPSLLKTFSSLADAASAFRCLALVTAGLLVHNEAILGIRRNVFN